MPIGFSRQRLLLSVVTDEPSLNPDGLTRDFRCQQLSRGHRQQGINLLVFQPSRLCCIHTEAIQQGGQDLQWTSHGWTSGRTIKWSVQDNQGKQHDWLLPKSHFVPNNGMTRLLSPQHWAQCMPRRWRATCATGADDMTLKWEDHQAVPCTITCPWIPGTMSLHFMLTPPATTRTSGLCL